MYEKEALVPTKYGSMPTFTVCPESGGPFPGIIIFFDAPGMREELRNLARRIANQGYFVLLPDLYYRLGTLRLDIPRRNDAMSAVIRGAMNSLTNDFVFEDTCGMVAYLDANDRVKPGAVGCVGYCMSGPFVVHAMARLPHRIVSGASLYGVNMVTDKPDSAHLLAKDIKGEIYLGFAEHDPGVPATVQPTLKADMDKAGVKYEMETVPNTHHGYQFPTRPDYNPIGSEASWKKMFAMWERTLKKK